MNRDIDPEKVRKILNNIIILSVIAGAIGACVILGCVS